MAGFGWPSLVVKGKLSCQQYWLMKPDPEIYLLAARRLEVSPAECLVAEGAAVHCEMAVVQVGRRRDRHVAFASALAFGQAAFGEKRISPVVGRVINEHLDRLERLFRHIEEFGDRLWIGKVAFPGFSPAAGFAERIDGLISRLLLLLKIECDARLIDSTVVRKGLLAAEEV